MAIDGSSTSTFDDTLAPRESPYLPVFVVEEVEVVAGARTRDLLGQN